MIRKIYSVVAQSALMFTFIFGQAQALTLGSLGDADSSFGAATVTRDAVSGLEWLDLDRTVAFSFNSIAAELGAGGIFEGFFMASSGQVGTLLTNSGILTVANGAPAQAAFERFVGLLGGQVDDFAGLGCVLALNGIVNNGGASGIAGVGIDRKPAAGDGCGPILAGSEFITTGPVPVGLPIDPNETINTHNGSSPITIGGLFLAREFNNSVDAPSTLAMLLLGLLLTPKMLHRRR